MKLVYNSFIDLTEQNQTSSNIGARKGKSPRDHLFVLYSVITDTIYGQNKDGIDLVLYDVSLCYDALWVEHTLLDLHSNGVDSNLLNLVYEGSKSASIKIKTPVGTSDSKEITDQVMQGETVSSILCTSTVDKISKDNKIKEYKYRE